MLANPTLQTQSKSWVDWVRGLTLLPDYDLEAYSTRKDQQACSHVQRAVSSLLLRLQPCFSRFDWTWMLIVANMVRLCLRA